MLAQAGDRAEAVSAMEEASTLYERKGNLVEAQKARSFIDADPPSSTA